MTKSEDNDLWLYGILGALGSAALYFLSQMGPPKFGNQGVNSYQSQSSYTPPTPPKQGGCGCSAGR